MLLPRELDKFVKLIDHGHPLSKEDTETLIRDFRALYDGLVAIAETGCEGDEEDYPEDCPCCGDYQRCHNCLPCSAQDALEGRKVKLPTYES